jgi:hypothetical protein
MKKNLKELTKEDKDFFSVVYTSKMSHEERCEKLSKYFGVSHRTVRAWAVKLEISSPDSALPPQLKKVQEKMLPDCDVVLVTSCQDRTMINYNLLKGMLSYKSYIESLGKTCEIVVIPVFYRNPTSVSNNKDIGSWWSMELEDYLYYDKLYFDNVMIHACARITPTASEPLNGYEALASENHLILGHPRIHFKTLPRYKGEEMYSMCTTGFISQKNYSNSKSGDKGTIHHSYGFVICEKGHFPRNVFATTDGNFCDIGVSITDGIVSRIEKIPAIVLGDIHNRELKKEAFDSSVGLIESLGGVETCVLHDVFDGATVNPHEKNDLYIRKKNIRKGRYSVKEEVDESLFFLKDMKSKLSCNIVVCQSNHDVFLDRWVNDENWKKDLHNSDGYLYYSSIQQSTDLEEDGCVFGHLVNKLDKDITYLPYSKSYSILGVQVGHHGDKGANGSRGSVNGFKKSNKKRTIGHGHSPQIMDGVFMVGVLAELWQYYNSGSESSWAHANCITHSNGKRQLLVMNKDYKVTSLL